MAGADLLDEEVDARQQAVEFVARLADRLAGLAASAWRPACRARSTMPWRKRCRQSMRSASGSAAQAGCAARAAGCLARHRGRVVAVERCDQLRRWRGCGCRAWRLSTAGGRALRSRTAFRKSFEDRLVVELLGMQGLLGHELGVPLHAEDVARAVPAQRFDQPVGHRMRLGRPGRGPGLHRLVVDRVDGDFALPGYSAASGVPPSSRMPWKLTLVVLEVAVRDRLAAAAWRCPGTACRPCRR